eukprot:760886-Hanusia_phi.AAC.3
MSSSDPSGLISSCALQYACCMFQQLLLSSLLLNLRQQFDPLLHVDPALGREEVSACTLKTSSRSEGRKRGEVEENEEEVRRRRRRRRRRKVRMESKLRRRFDDLACFTMLEKRDRSSSGIATLTSHRHGRSGREGGRERRTRTGRDLENYSKGSLQHLDTMGSTGLLRRNRNKDSGYSGEKQADGKKGRRQQV